MIDIFLKAPDKTTLLAGQPFVNMLEGGPACYTHEYALDLIGPVVTIPATFDAEGAELTPAVFDSQFHANLRLLDESLEVDIGMTIIIAAPNNPRRAWA